MPKVVSGKGFDEFVQSGKHQTIDEPKKPTQAPKIEPPKEVKELVQAAETATEEAMKPAPEPEETGLEADDDDLAEKAKKKIAKKHREMKQADALAKKLRAELDDTEAGFKSEYLRAQAAEEEASKLRKQIEELQAKTPTQVADKPGIKPPDENDPKFRNDKGEFQLKVYEAARDEYVKAQIREELRAEAEQKENESKVAKFVERREVFSKEHPDFNEVTGHDDPVLPFVQRFIIDSEIGPEIGYYFGNNRDELKRIQALHPIRASAELGKLEAKLEAAKQKAPVKEPEAKPLVTPPAPISPLSGSGSPGVNSDPAKMTPKELLAYTREREAAKKRAKLGLN